MNAISTYSIRPTRKLFYIHTTKEDIQNYYKGILPPQIAAYNGAFGTYGYPGLFLVEKEGETIQVIGIEYRPDDNRIDYPEDLNEMLLPGNFFRSDVLIDHSDDTLSEEIVQEHVQEVCGQAPTYRFYMEGSVSVKPNPDIVQVFVSENQSRVMISADYVPDFEQKDITEDAKRYKNLYYHDTTTGHHNWNYIWPRMSGCNYYGIQDYAFVYFDIKDFNAINVVYGHLTANELLKLITTEMKKLDWVYESARCDNDNFAMMIKDMPAAETEEKLQQFFEKISRLPADENYRVYYRCGVVPMRSTIEMGNLVADAGKQAKNFGTTPFKTEVIFFTDAMREEQNQSIRLRAYLDQAIERDEFVIYLQPKYDIIKEKVIGAEALIRWNYKGKMLYSPAKFIPIFEAGGLITKMDDIVLKKVCKQLKRWEQQGKKLYPISVNVSRKSVGVPGLVEHLTAIVDAYGVDHNLIEFELTESAAYDNQENMLRVIASIKNNGFKISVDDFGTGYSSLSLLPVMPFDTLKIDKSFVDRIGNSEECIRSCAVVRQIVALAKDLDMVCLAEGTEQLEQVNLLREFGCERVQGYYYSKPLPIEEYELLL